MKPWPKLARAPALAVYGFTLHSKPKLHKIFTHEEIKMRCEQLLKEAIAQLGIQYKEIGIDKDSLLILDIALYPVHKVVKKLIARAKHLLREYPFLKQKYFWGSGLWNPSYYFDSLGRDIEELTLYVRKQGISTQTTLAKYLINTN